MPPGRPVAERKAILLKAAEQRLGDKLKVLTDESEAVEVSGDGPLEELLAERVGEVITVSGQDVVVIRPILALERLQRACQLRRPVLQHPHLNRLTVDRPRCCWSPSRERVGERR